MTSKAGHTAGALHPYCRKCGWRKGGIDSWDGAKCKCGEYEPPMVPVEADVIALPAREKRDEV